MDIILDLNALGLTHVNSDPGRIRQILTNILSNAVKFTDSGQVLIRAQLTQSSRSDFLQFSCEIIDTGIGISKDKQASLFDAFSQGDASTTRKYGGTGLGLSITRKLCNLLHGDVVLSSEFGKGSCFTISCLVKKLKVPAKPKILPQFSSLKILLAESNLDSCSVLKAQLLRLSARVDVCHNIDHLVRKLNASTEILIVERALFNLLDEHTKKQLKHLKTKVVLLVPFSETLEYQDYQKLGINLHLFKPVTPTRLFAAISTLMGSQEQLTVENNQSQEPDKNELSQQHFIGTHVLLVEDNPVNQIVALNVLKSLGVSADVASNGHDALTSLQAMTEQNFYAVIIMDCQMPEMDGYETSSRIKAGEAGDLATQIPIIAMTANAMHGDKQKCLEAGMDDYMTKPIEKDVVYYKLKRWIN